MLPKVCEVPTLISSCPTGAIRPATLEGKPSVDLIKDQCMFCGNCYTVCPAMPLNDPEDDGMSIWAGGKVSNALGRRSSPSWRCRSCPTTRRAGPSGGCGGQNRGCVRQHARKYERVGEWIERVGWPRFFQLTGFEFTRYHIDDFKHAGLTYARSAQIRY